MRIQYAARVAAGAALAALLVGSTATATSGASPVSPPPAQPVPGHSTSEWQMGPGCGAGAT